MLTVSCEYRLGILFIRLKGDLNINTISKFDKKIISKIKEGGIVNIVLNLTKLSSIDTKGIYKLLYCYELVNKNNGSIFICGNNDKINKKIKENHLLNYISEISNELTAYKIINMRVI